MFSAAVGMPPPSTHRRKRGIGLLRQAEEESLPPSTPSSSFASKRVLAAQQALQCDTIEGVHCALQRDGPPPGEAGARFQRLIAFLRVNGANVVQSAAVCAEASVCAAQIARALSVRRAARPASRSRAGRGSAEVERSTSGLPRPARLQQLPAAAAGAASCP